MSFVCEFSLSGFEDKTCDSSGPSVGRLAVETSRKRALVAWRRVA